MITKDVGDAYENFVLNKEDNTALNVFVEKLIQIALNSRFDM